MPIIDTLRRETRAAHDAIEAAVDFDRHLDSRATYGALIARYHEFHHGFERARDHSPARPIIEGSALVPPSSRAELLRTDLLALEIRPTGERQDDLPLALPTLGHLLGAIYVVEGSSMGGVLLARLVEKRLGIGADDGAAFLTGDGRATARRWREIMAALETFGDPSLEDRAVATALETFALMQDWLTAAPAQRERTLAVAL